MNSEIEMLDKKRLRYLEWYLSIFAVFIILMIIRFFFRRAGLNSQPVGVAVLAGLFITLALLTFCMLKTVLLARRIRRDPLLEEALHNELVRALETQSWKAAFLGAVGATVFFALVKFVYPVCDPVMVALTSIIVGSGAYQATFYFKYRSS